MSPSEKKAPNHAVILGKLLRACADSETGKIANLWRLLPEAGPAKKLDRELKLLRATAFDFNALKVVIGLCGSKSLREISKDPWEMWNPVREELQEREARKKAACLRASGEELEP